MSDGAGQALAINTHDAYGILAPGNFGRFRYTGQACSPELGMYDDKARICSPTLGRFLRNDPIGYGAALRHRLKRFTQTTGTR